jgi:hypothetical protein
MNSSDRKLFTHMYKQLIKYMLYPPEFQKYSPEEMEKTTQQQAINHIYSTLLEYDVIVDKRTLNIDKIID